MRGSRRGRPRAPCVGADAGARSRAAVGAALADLVGAVIVKVPAALAPAHELAEAVELPIGHVHLRGRQRVPLQLHLIVVAVYIHLAAAGSATDPPGESRLVDPSAVTGSAVTRVESVCWLFILFFVSLKGLVP